MLVEILYQPLVGALRIYDVRIALCVHMTHTSRSDFLSKDLF